HPGASLSRLYRRYPGKRPGRRSGDLPLACSPAGDRCVFDAARRSSSRGDLMQTRLSAHALRKIAHVLVITLFTVALAFPFYWMVVTSFKQNVDLYTMENNPFVFNAR